MAVSVFKTWTAGEVLSAADLKSSFTQITSNGEDLAWPATKAKDFGNQNLTNGGTASFTTITGSGVLSIDDTTDSTSATTGSIHTDGGLGVAKDLYVGAGIIMGTSGEGISFSATSDGSGTATSELFDDYEEGTFVPTFFDAAAAGNEATYTTQEGRYIKSGTTCYIYIFLNIAGIAGMTGGNQAHIRGLPYSASSTPTSGDMASVLGGSGTGLSMTAAGDGVLIPLVEDSDAYIRMGCVDNSVTTGTIAMTVTNVGTGTLNLSGTYETA